MARLVVESSNEPGLVFPLRQDSVTVGRSASATFQIVDKRVSRHHALFQRHKDAFTVEDLGSKNGTFINDEPLIGRIKLKAGDKVQVGDTCLVYEPEEEDISSDGVESTGSHVRFVPGDVGTAVAERPVEAALMPTADPTQFGEDEDIAGAYDRLKVLYEVAELIGSGVEGDELFARVVDVLMRVLTPHRLLLLLKNDSGHLVPAVVRSPHGEDEAISVSRGILDRALSESIAILVSDAPSDIRFADNESVIAGRIRSCICAPLISKGEKFGVLYLDSQDPGPTYYTNDDLEMVTIIVNQTAMALVNAKLRKQDLERQKMAKELEIACEIQRNLLPREIPFVAGLDLSAMSEPARQVGGDYYDFILLKDGRLAIVIADVSGKGVPAAILTASIRGSLRLESALGMQGPVHETVAALNRWTCLDASNNMFITLAYAVFDPVARSLSYSNAGHVYPLLFKADGSYVYLDRGGCFLGIMDMLEYESDDISVDEGDILVMYTDGLTDTHQADNETFGEARLVECVRANRHLTAGELKDELYEATVVFRGGHDQFDDLTIIVAKF